MSFILQQKAKKAIKFFRGKKSTAAAIRNNFDEIQGRKEIDETNSDIVKTEFESIKSLINEESSTVKSEGILKDLSELTDYLFSIQLINQINFIRFSIHSNENCIESSSNWRRSSVLGTIFRSFHSAFQRLKSL